MTQTNPFLWIRHNKPMPSLRIMIHNLNPYPSFAWFYYFIIICCALCTASDGHGKTLVVNHLAPDSSNDKRLHYSTELIKLALNKTLKPGESIEYQSIPTSSPTRARSLLNGNQYPNLILPLSYEDNMQESSIDYIPFPTELGALSYRVCFISPRFFQNQRKIQTIHDFNDYSFGVGVGWPDVHVLKANQLSVVEVSKYENIFKMLFNSRFDFFCRGLGEMHDEFLTFGSTYQLQYDRTFLLHAPMPRFFFVNKNNQELKQRLKTGLVAAYQDGSLIKLWKQHYAASVKFCGVQNRRLLSLKNDRIRHVQAEYQQYLLTLQDYASLH